MKYYDLDSVKKTALILVISLLVAVVILTGCSSPDPKMEKSQPAVIEANREYRADIYQYYEEAIVWITANHSTITA